MTTVLITGARGQLGSELVRAAAAAGIPTQAFDSAGLDITDPEAVRAVLTEFARWSQEVGTRTGDVTEVRVSSDPEPTGSVSTRAVVINAAAYTAVDQAETDLDAAYAINAAGPTYLAQAAAQLGLGLVHVSTDYVFPGDANRPYEIDDPTGPRSVYGASKLEGEQAVLDALPEAHVVRTAWVWGATGSNFVKTMLGLEATRPELSVVDDQRGTPTSAADLAAGLIELAGTDLDGGVLHATNGGETTWYGFARAIFDEIGADPERVRPTTSAEFARPAPRPAYSVLSNAAWAAAGLTALRPWRAALTAALQADANQFRP